MSEAAAGRPEKDQASFRAGLLLAMATVLTYLPSFAGAFLWDDNRYVTKPDLQSLRGLARIWFEPGAAEQYYPLLHTFLWIQHRLWGDHPIGYHLVTVSLHIAAAVLFARLLTRLQVPGAWWSAALFALHPVHVESVAWIAEQKNTLSLVLVLAAALAYLRFDETRGSRDYGAAFALFVLAILSKTVAVTLPAVLLVLAWWKRGRISPRRDLLPLIPWFAVGAAAGLFTSWVERHFLGATGVAFARPFAERLILAGRAVAAYVAHLAWPRDLSFVYPHWTAHPGSPLDWLPLAGVAALGGLLWAGRKRSRGPLAAYLIFLGTLWPALGFVNLYGSLYSPIWDHWQYLPDLALLALAGAGIVRLASAGRPLGLAALVLLGILSYVHAKQFSDDETLFRATLRQSPDSWMAENNLAATLDRTGRVDEALLHYGRALALQPDRPEYIHINRGLALVHLGRYPQALGEYREALRENPHEVNAQIQIGITLASLGHADDAVPCFEAALRDQPARRDVSEQLARALLSLHRTPEAIAVYRAALERNPARSERLHYQLGLALADAGRPSEARLEFQQAVRLDPSDAEAQTDLGIALANAGRVADAVVAFREVVRLRPQSPDAHENLSEALRALGQTGEADQEAARAVSLRLSQNR